MLTTEIKRTDQLPAAELLEILEARVRVFVVEQHCAYQEVDIKDRRAEHVILRQNGRLAAYARIIPSDDKNAVSFGRVLVVKTCRGQGLARQLILATLARINQIAPAKPIKIQAQNYLRHFYADFGFTPISSVYLEDGIPHVDMLRQPKNQAN
ncbi:GNAT family N-acetyltransferase [Lacticaseibacillus camelliae]|uniref:ElaA protein n=1 Tax=Lacticaseibacillus camelliae DSM 22697 = JCM 13995 TaxID=1423730 RepID=A0A0R2F391_9LACO|nr:GNAT family N-acetyltransferase [Lacticaseibacillus camelliae]KRN22946.1 ElaA protein [Lacticaseibacillus camelliae DSM 22697 = JCM 13995]